MAFRTIFIESKCRCSYQGGYLVVRKTDETKKIHLSEISSIILQDTQVYVSAYLLSELAKSKISLVVSDERCSPIGQYLPLYGAHNASKRVVEQLAWGEPIKKRVWQRIVKEKIRQQACLLEEQECVAQARALMEGVDEVRSGDTTNREAWAARIYFSALFGRDFSRDADAPLNAALNYGYAVLLSMVSREIVSRGYLTQCGICHRNEYNQFNLACDFMEPFRPLVDYAVISELGVSFDVAMRRKLGSMACWIVSYKGGSYKLGSVVSLYVKDCFAALNKELPVTGIEGFERR